MYVERKLSQYVNPVDCTIEPPTCSLLKPSLKNIKSAPPTSLVPCTHASTRSTLFAKDSLSTHILYNHAVVNDNSKMQTTKEALKIIYVDEDMV